MANDDGIYWTVRNNWDGKLWPRLWPNERAAWAALKEETGMTKKMIQETCDWRIVKVKIVEAVPNAEIQAGRENTTMGEGRSTASPGMES